MKNTFGQVVGDLNKSGLMFAAARGGAGGRGNTFFATSIEQTPKICEYGADGEDLSYEIELRCMAHIGLVSIFLLCCIYNWKICLKYFHL